MNIVHKFTAVLIFLGLTAGTAQSAGFACQGQDPDWRLTFDDAGGAFYFPARTKLNLMLTTPAQGQDWPRAYTLVGDRDTAIALIERESCGDALPYRAHVMTQRGQTPILLSGCCQDQK